jgi:Papain family cysteine protease
MIMPIRMVDDPNDQSNENYDNDRGGRGGGGSGGGNILLQFLPMLIGFIFRKPLMAIPILLIGGFVFFKGGCNSISNNSMAAEAFSTGGNLDPKEFAKADVYEGLDDSKNNLPEYISLLKFAPERLNQGQQGSCVAWSAAYAARTIIEAASTNQNPNQLAFSPSFLYNQIKLDGCQGSYIIRAMENMTKVGSVPFNSFPYNEKDCSAEPSMQLQQMAEQFKMLGFNRLTDNESTRGINIRSIKEHLANDVPVVIGMMVGGSFMQQMQGKDVWIPQDEDYNMLGFGGHAMCVIGYDDRKEGGAFEIMNSWGKDWGNNGVAWVKYADFKHFTREAYGVNAMPKKGDGIATNLACSFGLIDAATKQYIPLQNTGDNIFENTTTIAKGTTFKVEVKNENECYVYVLGKEVDGSSYVLFPYPSKADANKTKFSPYCGITGYRLFPRGMSLQADTIGVKDYMTIITSKEQLDVFALNNAVNANKNLGFEKAVQTAVKRNYNTDVAFKANSNGSIAFTTADGDTNMVACIIGINKK